MRNLSTEIICIFFLSILLIMGCEAKKEVQKKAPVTAPVAKKKKDVVEKRVEVPEEKYVFTTEGKRDPFKSFIKKKKVKMGKPGVALTPLQKFDVTQLKLIGIISGVDENKAMIADPTGKGYILTKGTLIGKNFGRVKNISKNEVVIIEDIEDFLGNIITKEIPLILDTGEEKK